MVSKIRQDRKDRQAIPPQEENGDKLSEPDYPESDNE